MENKKNNNRLIIMCIVLVIITIFGGFIGYYIGVSYKNTPLPEIEETKDDNDDKNNEKTTDTNNEEKTTDTNNEEEITDTNNEEEITDTNNEEEITDTNNEEEITDTNTIKTLSNKISRLFGYKENELNLNSEYSMFSFKSGVLKKKLTNDEKQLLIAIGIEWDQITDNLWETSPKMKNIAEGTCGGDTNCIKQYIEKSKQVSEEKFNKYSLELFGHEITNPKEVIGKCPIIYYDANQKRYYRPDPACGGAAAERAKLYKYKFTTKEDEAYVYVSFAYVEPDYNNKSIYNVYKDIECNNELIGTCKFINKYEGTKPEHVDDFKLDKTNYQEFSQYKFTFKKDQNKNYYFIKTERIK